MAKKSGNEDASEKARQRLAKATLRLNVAQQKHAQAREQGKQIVEQARLEAAKILAKAAERVERRAVKVAKAEAEMRGLREGEAGEDAAAAGGRLATPDALESGESSIHLEGANEAQDRSGVPYLLERGGEAAP